MYEIVLNFIQNSLFGVEHNLVYILTDISMILFYVVLVNLLVFVFKVCASWVKL